MESVRPSQVPEYLRTSSFFLGLNLTDDDEFSIPKNHMKLNTNVDALADVTELLNTVRFWGSDVIPQSIIDFVSRQLLNEVDCVLEPFRADLPVITTVCNIVSESENVIGISRMEKAMESGNIDVVKFFHIVGEPFSDRAIALAAGKGALDCLKYVISSGTFRFNSYTGKIFFEAVRNGRMDSILFLQQNGFSLRNRCYGCAIVNEELVKIAASAGQCEVLKYLHTQGCSIHSAAIVAADAGHFDCLEYAIQHGALLRDEYTFSFEPSDSLAQRLARIDQPHQAKLLAMALSRGGAMDAQTVYKFAKSGNWECFRLCVPYVVEPPTDLIAVVVEKGHLASLRYLHKIYACNAKKADTGLNWITHAARSSCNSPLPIEIAQLVARTRQWQCLRFLIVHGCPMDKHLTTSLVRAGQLELFRLALEHGCAVSVRVACQFVKEGNLALLKHALEHGCERSEEILRTAVQYGQLQCLKYAHAQGCPWHTPISLTAARGAHLECLQYLYDHSGCAKRAWTTK